MRKQYKKVAHSLVATRHHITIPSAAAEGFHPWCGAQILASQLTSPPGRGVRSEGREPPLQERKPVGNRRAREQTAATKAMQTEGH